MDHERMHNNSCALIRGIYFGRVEDTENRFANLQEVIDAGVHAYFEEYLADTESLLAIIDQRGFRKHLQSTLCRVGRETSEERATHQGRGWHAVLKYNGAMDLSLHVVWKLIPAAIELKASETEDGLDIIDRFGFLYTIGVSVVLAAATGASVKYLGFPGGLPDVIKCVHNTGFVPMKQTVPMIFASLFSIAAGGSVGPEAPLAAVSASVTGWLSMHYFKHDVAMARKCTIIGMSAGLSALFGVQLGGGLFALEVLHTMGMQFFDVAVYAIGAGGICLTVYRGLRGESIGAIWTFEDIPQSNAAEIIFGTAVGALAGIVGIAFRSLFRAVGKGVKLTGFGYFEDTKSPILLAALGGFCISIIGVLVPPTMFWSEFEIGCVAQPGKDLPFIWPQGGLFYGLDRYPWESAPMYMLVGAAKLLAIACAVQSGFRGGFIFPLFFAGASFGRGLLPLAELFLPVSIVNVSPVLISMSFAAGLNVAVTRTPFASPLILAVLSGQPNIAAPVTCASLASLFITRSAKFISPQTDRADLQFVGDLQPLQEAAPPTDKVKGDTAPDAEKGALLNGTSVNGGYSAIAIPDAQVTTTVPV